MTAVSLEHHDPEAAMASRLETAQSVAREAGQMAKRFLADRSNLAVELKGPQDFVSEADRAVEELIVKRLSAAFPNDGFVGEEGGQAITGQSEGSSIWIIDPIDGTANFVQGRSEWCVSIGLLKSRRPALGVIYHPSADELFAAAAGHGATRDGVSIRVSTGTTLAAATVALEYSLKAPPAAHLAHVAAVLGAGGEYRRNGSAALSLAHVADGRLDGFVELHVHAWDVVAGMVLIAEAGGWTSPFPLQGDLRRAGPLVAGGVGLRADLLRVAGANQEADLA
jgi:myo-inositol-1(or 4)-monophosphatase